MKTLILIGVLMVGFNAWAVVNSAADSTSVMTQNNGVYTYTIHDGYSESVGQGPTKIAAESEARSQCVQHLVVAYEYGHQGLTPDADTADLMIDACINK